MTALAIAAMLIVASSSSYAGGNSETLRPPDIMLTYPSDGVNRAMQPVIQGPLTLDGNHDQKDIVGIWPSSAGFQRGGEEWIQYYLQPNMKLGVSFTNNYKFVLTASDPLSHQRMVPDGWYLLQMAVLKPQLNQALDFHREAGLPKKPGPYERFVTSASVFVEVSGGQINDKEITLKFPNLTVTSLMNHLYIELSPLARDCGTQPNIYPCINFKADGKPDPINSEIQVLPGYKPYLIDMPFLPSQEGSQRSGKRVDASEVFGTENLRKFIAKTKLLQGESDRGISVGQFVQDNKLQYLSIHDPGLMALGRTWFPGDAATVSIKQLIERPGIGSMIFPAASHKLYPLLCYALFRQNEGYAAQSATAGAMTGNWLNYCSHQPDKVMRLSRVTHVMQFDESAAQPLFAQAMKFGLQANFMVSRSHSDDNSVSFNPLASVFNLVESFGVPLSAAGFHYTVSASNGISTSESSSGSELKTLDFNMIGMEFPVLRARRCLEIKPLPNSGVFWDARPEAKHNGLYICLDESRESFRGGEVYSHIYDHPGNTSIIDASSALAQAVNVSLQGDREISTFYYRVRGALTPHHNSKIRPFDMLASAQAMFNATPLANSNLIVNPIDFYRADAPSMVQRVVGDAAQHFMQDGVAP